VSSIVIANKGFYYYYVHCCNESELSNWQLMLTWFLHQILKMKHWIASF